MLMSHQLHQQLHYYYLTQDLHQQRLGAMGHLGAAPHRQALLAGIEGPSAPLAADASGARLRLGERVYDLRIVPMRGTGAPRGGRLMTFHDVTVRLQAARERLQRVEELRSMSAQVQAARGGLPGHEPVP
jgi:hypothetical protein